MWKIARISEPKFLLFYVRIAELIVIVISTRVAFWEIDFISPILNQDLKQGKFMAAVNSRK